MKKWLFNLKIRWNIKSNFQLLLIFIVFGLTGSFSLKLAKPILYYLGFSPEIFNNIFLGDFFYWSLRLIIIFPIYQLLLLFFGFLFFQFSFFWELEKKFLIKIGFGKFFSNTKKNN
tara:strand:- start:84 stop:431 length:348 start_codon:yes stop_codon:yes gene_type:complete